MTKFPNLETIAVIPEDCHNTGVFFLNGYQLLADGLSANLRQVLIALRDYQTSVSNFVVEHVSSRYGFYAMSLSGHEFPGLSSVSFTSGELLSSQNAAAGTGGYQQPASFIDNFKNPQTLSFFGHSHKTPGTAIAALLQHVHLPRQVKLELSDSTFFRGDILKFGVKHQSTLEYINLTRTALRGDLWDDMVIGLIEKDAEWGLNKAKLIAVSITKPCEAWCYTKEESLNDDLH
jgi:hypothetical protein